MLRRLRPGTNDYDRVADEDNLRRALRWTLSNTDRHYRQYFRETYSAFAAIQDELIGDLRASLKRGDFIAQSATKLFTPKASGVLRPMSLLRFEDQVVYQACANLIAERLHHKVRHRYMRSVFGHLYAGVTSPYFYRSWTRGYRAFTVALRSSFAAGYEYSASFDLTAFYDSIDHRVLCHFLKRSGLDDDFCAFVRDSLLATWTSTDHQLQFLHGHGIPQGPQASGLVAETVLQHLDDTLDKQKAVRYVRYVDDIRLLGRSERDVRRQLVRLDKACKEIGLFPQSGKIHLHRITDINAEIKSISLPPEPDTRQVPLDQQRLRKRLKALTPQMRIVNETRFKYVLAFATPNAELTTRLLTLSERYPHLGATLFASIAKAPSLSRKVSTLAVRILKQHDLYAAFSARLVFAVAKSLHKSQRSAFTAYCAKRLRGEADPELRVALVAVLFGARQLTWKQSQYNVTWGKDWWARTQIIQYVDRTVIGDPSYASLLNTLIADRHSNPAVVAASLLATSGLPLATTRSEIQRLAQLSLKKSGLIGRVRVRDRRIEDLVVRVLGKALQQIDWGKIFGAQYKELLPRFVRWEALWAANPTAWVNATDVLNEFIMARLFLHDPTLGKYKLGNIGGVLAATSAWALRMPRLHRAIYEIHEARLRSELSHPVHRTSNRPTRFISHKESRKLGRLLASGYADLWHHW